MHLEADLPLPACGHQRCAGSSGEDVLGGKPSPAPDPPGALPGEVTQEAWHWKPGRDAGQVSMATRRGLGWTCPPQGLLCWPPWGGCPARAVCRA